VLIARLMLQPADVLILDEPTNDLDIPSLEVLEESLLEFPGSLVLVTHDRYLLDRVSTEVLGLDGNGGHRYFADYGQWERSIVSPPTDKDKPARASKQEVASRPARLTASERRELNNMETAIENAEKELQRLEARLSDPAVASDAQALSESWDSVSKGRERIDRLYARWEELESKRDSG
jgi:ABC transport system ATP-binding/permease protein